MNQYEIEEAVARTDRASIIGRAARTLDAFKDLVNENSDGWAYWKAAGNAAKRLIAIVELSKHRPRSYDEELEVSAVTEKDYTKALIPIRRLCTKHKFTFPTISD